MEASMIVPYSGYPALIENDQYFICGTVVTEK